MINPPLHRAFVALGSNLGDREANLRQALAQLEASGDVRIARVSAFLDNPAVGGPSDSPAFLNAVAAVDTSLEPIELLQRLLTAERDMGRVRNQKWEPRLIDLDLLLYGDRVLNDESLTLPHPLLQVREFVLKPLAEVSPLTVHPVLGKTVWKLWEELQKRTQG